eukprot:scaffold51445_cov38-Cyclotella_meneghiniana.AAC.5
MGLVSGITIQTPLKTPLWQAFQDDFNDWHGLEWDFVGPNDSVDFMDITMKIVDGKIDFTFFEKALNLYLYIPPKSAHPPGVLTGLIFIWQHLSDPPTLLQR